MFLIRYQPAVRVNGQPHGPVYAVDMGGMHTGVPVRTAFAGTPDPDTATQFTYDEARVLIICHALAEAAIVPVDGAPRLR